MTRRRPGFFTLAKESLHELNHRYGLPVVARYVFLCLLAWVDEKTVIDGVAAIYTSERELADRMRIPQSTFRRARIKLVEAELVGWVVAKNGETLGQLTIPGYDWHASWEGEYDPLSHRRVAAESPVNRYDSLTPQLPAGTDTRSRSKKEKLLAQPATPDAKEFLREQISKAIAEACGIDPADMTASALGALAKAAKELHHVDATPDEIKARARRYRAKWPTATLSPSALAKHWAEFADKHASGTTSWPT